MRANCCNGQTTAGKFQYGSSAFTISVLVCFLILSFSLVRSITREHNIDLTSVMFVLLMGVGGVASYLHGRRQPIGRISSKPPIIIGSMKFTIGAAIFSLASIAWFMAELTVQGDDKYSIIPVMILTTAALFQSCIVAWGVRYRGKRLEEDYRFGQTSSVINLGLSFLGTAAVFGGATVFLRAEISLHSYFQLGVVGFLFIVSWWNCHRVNKTPARHA